ncbi:hypothetical protein CEV31_1678 [Brucella thiophenivorans]|uniref:Uncharacterized protein n=1 Tax=Brucella thiophenivorans TaxID=571255 RepID=A0A256FZI9_9HYPH|nr:hypothetical protein CEV31_1678 [Brucella thiophenivorans]
MTELSAVRFVALNMRTKLKNFQSYQGPILKKLKAHPEKCETAFGQRCAFKKVQIEVDSQSGAKDVRVH